MTFHRPGNYAAYFGLDTDNNFRVGGWSMGAASYKLWHDGNLTNLNQLTNGPGYITASGPTFTSGPYTNDYYRVNGNGGIYWQNWGGGWYMQDTTWLRTYGSKSIWTDTGTLGSNGGLTVGYSGTSPSSGGAIIAGSVGVGTSSPVATLDVNGSVKARDVSNAGAVIDFASGNLQYTSAGAGGYILYNMKSGGTYSLAVQGATGGACSFTAYSGSGTGALTVKTGPINMTKTANKHMLFTFMVMGSFVYVASIDNY